MVLRRTRSMGVVAAGRGRNIQIRSWHVMRMVLRKAFIPSATAGMLQKPKYGERLSPKRVTPWLPPSRGSFILPKRQEGQERRVSGELRMIWIQFVVCRLALFV